MSAAALFESVPIVPVVTVDRAEHAVPLAEALCAAGIMAIEVTLRTDCALQVIERIATAVPQMLVGAGSIREPGHVRQVGDAGARFGVSPGVTDALLAEIVASGLPFVPGAATASEMLRLWGVGFDFMKFFPAEANGGASALAALCAPMPELRFFPTGGINPANLQTYLALDAVVCVGGSWFIPQASLRAGDFARIGALAAAARELALD